MKIALLADIHGNPEAFKAVKATEAFKEADEYWFLGDLVGRGPDPEEPLQWLLAEPRVKLTLLGNHEVMLADRLSQYQLNGVDRLTLQTIERHRELPEIQKWLHERVLPSYAVLQSPVVRDDVAGAAVRTIVAHATLKDPLGISANSYGYPWQDPKRDDLALQPEFEEFSHRAEPGLVNIRCAGHTHIPTLMSSELDGSDIQACKVCPRERYPLTGDRLWLVNPGSVGCPRDLNERAAFAVLEISGRDVSVTYHRVKYDLEALSGMILRKRFPLETERRFFRGAKPPGKLPEDWVQHFLRAKEVG